MQLILRFTDFSENISFLCLWNPESLQNIDKISMRESTVHFRHKSYGRVLWKSARFAAQLSCPLGHAQPARCDVLYKPYIPTLSVHNLSCIYRLLFRFISCLQGLVCVRINAGFFVFLKPVTRQITGTYKKGFSKPWISCVGCDIRYSVILSFPWCTNQFKHKRKLEGKYDFITDF
jgi:hypothetical protein